MHRVDELVVYLGGEQVRRIVEFNVLRRHRSLRVFLDELVVPQQDHCIFEEGLSLREAERAQFVLSEVEQLQPHRRLLELLLRGLRQIVEGADNFLDAVVCDDQYLQAAKVLRREDLIQPVLGKFAVSQIEPL